MFSSLRWSKNYNCIMHVSRKRLQSIGNKNLPKYVMYRHMRKDYIIEDSFSKAEFQSHFLSRLHFVKNPDNRGVLSSW